MLNKKLLLLGFLLALFSLVAAQCGVAPTIDTAAVNTTSSTAAAVEPEADSGAEAAAAAENEEEEPVTLQYWMSMTEKEAEEQETLKRFEEEHPGIEVELTVNPPVDHLTKVRASLVSGNNPPDVAILVHDSAWDFGDAGLLADIGPWVERDLDLDDFYMPVKQKVSGCDGNMYGLGRNWVVSMLLYNQDLFDEAGLDYPDESWTWEDFRDAAKTLTKDADGDGRIDQYGAFVAPDHLQADPIIWAFGGKVYSAEDNQTHFSDPKSLEALQFLADMIQVDESAPPGSLVSAWGQAREDPFATGQVAMRINGSWMLGRYRDLNEFRWSVAPLPQGPEGRFVYGGSDILYVTQHAVDRGVGEEAWELARWLLTPDAGVTWYTSSNPGHMPGNKKIAESQAYKEAISQNGYEEEIEVVLFSNEFAVNPFTKSWREWRTKVNATLSDTFNGVMALEEAAEIADEEANAILAEWECPNP